MHVTALRTETSTFLNFKSVSLVGRLVVHEVRTHVQQALRGQPQRVCTALRTGPPMLNKALRTEPPGFHEAFA